MTVALLLGWNIAIGIAVGVALGVVFGSVFDMNRSNQPK
jgi:cell shape-determining protein MreD